MTARLFTSCFLKPYIALTRKIIQNLSFSLGRNIPKFYGIVQTILKNSIRWSRQSTAKLSGSEVLTKSGCLDMLFVRQDCLRQGIATALCDQLEKGFSSVKTYASITAKPFFEQRGYLVTEKRTVVRNGVQLINFEMKKSLS